MTEAPKNGSTKWTMWSSVVGSAVIAIGFMSTVAYQVVSISVQQSLQAGRNEDVARRLDLLRGDIEGLKLGNAQQKAALIEIETQFCASDTARNLMHANDLRLYAVIYEKVFGAAYPVANAYYPKICNRDPKR
jgi:hypothetical protein